MKHCLKEDRWFETKINRPSILLSMCLGVKPVRYDGNIIYDNFVETLKKYVDVIPICPEVGIGLSVPRNPLVLIKKNDSIELIDSVTKHSYTKDLERYFNKLTELTMDLVFDGALLKSSSPSCGVNDTKIYGETRNVVGKSDGLFTYLLRSRYPYLPIESEKRLYNYDIRRRFLTKIFSLAELRAVLNSLNSVEELVEFHRRYKYLIMLHDQSSLKKLGKLLGDRNKYSVDELVSKYREEFIRALSRNPTRKSYVNVFLHIYSHFKEKLNTRERKFILELIARYRDGYLSLRVVIEYLRGFIYRFENRYLAEQKLFSPYPEELEYAGLELE